VGVAIGVRMVVLTIKSKRLRWIIFPTIVAFAVEQFNSSTTNSTTANDGECATAQCSCTFL
jgi:hypothetical protein